MSKHNHDSCGCSHDDHHDHHHHDHEHNDGCGCGHDHGSADGLKVKISFLCISLAITIFSGFISLPWYFNTVLFIVAFLLAGYDVLFTAVKNIFRGKIFDENFLMTIASIGAFIIGEHVEAASVMIFYGIGEALQGYAVRRSRGNISKLLDIRPDYANILVGEDIKIVDPDTVKIGDIIIVKPGEKIPLDGVIISGISAVDTSALTGESIPRDVVEGNDVLSGSINGGGLLKIQVTEIFSNSTVAKILELTQNASSKKAKAEKFISKFAKYYTPAVVFGAVAVAFIPPILGFGDLSGWVYKALSFLIISCPCALVISIPISFFGGIGGAAKHGILIKGGNYLEAINSAENFVFDKTGTLTLGKFSVSNIYPISGVTEEELLALAVTAEQNSNHPIAKSIMAKHTGEITPVVSYEDRAGYGIIATTADNTIYAGNKLLMESIGFADIDSTDNTAVYIADKDGYKGYIEIADIIKPDAKNGIAKLLSLGKFGITMLTGDNNFTAKKIAAKLGIKSVYSELLPADKVTKLEDIMKAGGTTVFVGDGINDAPVLSRADIGIAMGGVGSDAAIEAADIVIMTDEVEKIATAVKIARKTRSIVMQNIVFSLGVKALIMLLTVIGITSIWFAIFADVGVALIAIINATRASKI